MKFLITLMLLLGGLESYAQDFSIIGKWQSKDFGQTTIFHFKADSTVDIIVNSDTFNKWTILEVYALATSFKINATVLPCQLDFSITKVSSGELWGESKHIFKKINGGLLMICFIQGENVRPTTFVTKTREDQFCLTFKRIP